jgi:hypothetical protein
MMIFVIISTCGSITCQRDPLEARLPRSTLKLTSRNVYADMQHLTALAVSARPLLAELRIHTRVIEASLVFGYGYNI